MNDIGRVLVTGGAGGLGAAIVDAVRDGGGTPLVLDLKPSAGDVPYRAVDLSDTRAAETATTALIADAGGIDAVITAAGIDVPGRIDDIPGPDWERIIAVDLLAVAAVIRAAIPALRASRGNIVTVASTLGLRAVSDASAYCAAKFGVIGLTRALGAELAGDIDVTLLVPGGMRTGFFDGRSPQYAPGPDAALNDPAAVANAVLFVLQQPPGCAVRELVITPSVEPSYP
jgi:NAD(P)-dependent dehydrogenase (short-subunit alcohol dehydrogenase family)